MIRKHSTLVALTAALGLALVGCGNDDNGTAGSGGTGGTGGTAGTGGNGGTGGVAEMASVNVAHLAPDVPASGDTAVDILLIASSGNTPLIQGLEFGTATGFQDLPVGSFTLGIAPAGSTEPVFTFEAELGAGAILTVVAYADSAGDGVNVLVFDSSTDGLADGSARVSVGHGADNPALTPVDVIVVGDCPPPLISDFVFGTVEEVGDLEVALDPIPIAFDLEGNCEADAGPLAAGLTPDVMNILVAVDDGGPVVYAIVGDASGALPTLEPLEP